MPAILYVVERRREISPVLPSLSETLRDARLGWVSPLSPSVVSMQMGGSSPLSQHGTWYGETNRWHERWFRRIGADLWLMVGIEDRG